VVVVAVYQTRVMSGMMMVVKTLSRTQNLSLSRTQNLSLSRTQNLSLSRTQNLSLSPAMAVEKVAQMMMVLEMMMVLDATEEI
jgi:hypothetical protein